MPTSTEFVHGWDQPWKNRIEIWRQVVSTHAFTHLWNTDQLEWAHVLILSCVTISRSILHMLINAVEPSRRIDSRGQHHSFLTRRSGGNHFRPRRNRFEFSKSMRAKKCVVESDESNTWSQEISAERVQKREYPARGENVMKRKSDRSIDWLASCVRSNNIDTGNLSKVFIIMQRISTSIRS